MSSQIVRPQKNSLVAPGPSLIRAASAIDNPKNVIGRYPYQWLFPGPHSKAIWVQKAIPLTGPASTDQIVQYQVSDGMIFSLRGYVVGAAAGSGWNEGTAELTFSLTVTAAGTRKVDFLNAIQTHVGSLESPYPILGRLEFQPLDVLTWSVANVAGPAAGKIVFAHLVGHEYPQAEGAV